MTKKVSFHDHEVVGARITHSILKRADCIEEKVKKLAVLLVRHHQFRFYEDTKDTTIKKWMRTLGREGWRLALLLRLMDRNGKDKNKNKPLITKEWRQLFNKCEKLEHGMVYFEQLAVSKQEIYKTVPFYKQKEALNNIVSIIEANKDRNTTKYIKSYLKTNYGVQNE